MYGKHCFEVRLADYQVLVKEVSLVCILRTNLFVTVALALHWGGCHWVCAAAHTGWPCTIS